MHTLWTNALGWLHWLAQGDNLTTAALAVAAVASSLKVLAQKLGLARAAAALGEAQEQIETRTAAAQKATTATVAAVRGLEEARKNGHLDADTFKKVTKTIQALAIDAGVEDHLAPIVLDVRAETPPAVVARTATARLTGGPVTAPETPGAAA